MPGNWVAWWRPASPPSYHSLMRMLWFGWVAAGWLAVPARVVSQPPASWAEVSRILGVPGAEVGGYQRFGLPRRDLSVTVGDVVVAPGLALGGWVGFDGMPNQAIAMGDLVVTADELRVVSRRLIDGGLSITAVHNHLAGERPQILYLHFHGHGAAIGIARTLDHALAATGTPRGSAASPPKAEPVLADTALIFRELNVTGRASGNVVNVSVTLIGAPVILDGAALRPSLALGSPINFQWIAAGRSVVTGDFAVTAQAAEGMIGTLIKNDIVVTSAHSHLIGESPAVTYIHFWGDGPLPRLIKGLKSAIDGARAAK